VLNDLRRDTLQALAKHTLKVPREQIKIKPNDYPYPVKELDFTGNVLNSKAAAFYKRHGVTEIAGAAEEGLDLRGRRVMTMKFCVRRRLGLCQKGKAVEPLYLEDEEGHKFRLDFDCEACTVALALEK
jgi:putative protease